MVRSGSSSKKGEGLTANVVPPRDQALRADVCIEAPDQGVGREDTLRGNVGEHQVLDPRDWARPSARVGLDVPLFLEEVLQGRAEDENPHVEKSTPCC